MISKNFDHNRQEPLALEIWKKFNISKFKGSPGKKYIHILPPPNANGELHLGHALGYACMDIMARYKRMNKYDVWLIPGKDHAGILTQIVFERKIKKEINKSRHDIGRKEFYKMCYDFCIDSAKRIREQEQLLGLSADFENERFTLDPKISKVVKQTFVNMYNDGIIYRENRMVNWCSRCSTALSDLEVEHKLKTGKIWEIKYPLADNMKKFIVVATTRPETMLGDTAVAVHPDDKRYKDIVGAKVVLPISNRKIKIIADKRVEKEFGTGAVKITPSHDPLDYEIGKDHNLEFISVINENGKMTKLSGNEFMGLSTIEARELVLRKLDNLGLLVSEKDFQHNIAVCERCGNIIEPLVSLQWFVNVNHPKFSLKKESIKAIKNGEINIYPKRERAMLVSWLENLHDWCISRQIWWGHQIPVYYCRDCGHEFAIVSDDLPICEKCLSSNVKQDEDVLDTWFSSGQWTYTALGWPENKEFDNFYPTDFMLMGRDIMFFWGIRMLMMSLYSVKKIPFKNLYLTGLVLDKHGKKMSKSKGNVISPLEIIKKYGADSLRFSLIAGTSAGQDMSMYEEKISGYRNFINKIWNASRFVLSNYEKENIDLNQKPKPKTVYDEWILGELNMLIASQHRNYAKYDFNCLGADIYSFTWSKYCDWYIEVNKGENQNKEMLLYVLANILKLLHPITPFVTENIWQMIDPYSSIASSMFPQKCNNFFEKSRGYVNEIFEIIGRIRTMKTRLKIVKGGDIYLNTKISLNDEIRSDIKRIAGISELYVNQKTPNIFLKDSTNLSEIFFRTTKEQINKLKTNENKVIGEIGQKIKSAEQLLDNKKFLKNAKPEIINTVREKLKVDKQRFEKLKQ